MLIVGLTGGIATGKSTVSETLKTRHNLTIIDADLIAKQVQEPNKPAYRAIVAYFQDKVPDLLKEDGTINSPALGRYVFANRLGLTKLNSIVHPAVRYEIALQVLKAYFSFNKMVILDVPLLFEAGLDSYCGVTVVVTCEESLQIERLLKRNSYLTLQDAENRIKSQLSNHVRINRADYVIDNSSTFEDLESQVDAVVSRIKPSLWIYVVELFPPFAILSALSTSLLRWYSRWCSRATEE
ncbi:hypothetical protein WICPIJ_004075 [Wickerhamomyces pijperi]|uniref:Dephospho-CoA kinase n=1 Tax=Wickerhamomyces pijperi TaxID=599730 RepID=A0A9P8Q6C2_WICPI|nr:hypothetical protein WICPIJ_004075 [Wickerhamomyces pijperi]